jgi:hypothetical protein
MAILALPIDATIRNLPIDELQEMAESWGLPIGDIAQDEFADLLVTLRELLDGRHTLITPEAALELHDKVLTPYDETTLETIERETVIIDLANHFDAWIIANPPV